MPTPSLKTLGLKAWLDVTRDLHNGNGYDRWIEIHALKPKWSPEVIAREFGVTTQTVYNWRKEEQNGAQPKTAKY